MKRTLLSVAAVLLLSIAGLGYFLFRPLSHVPVPADFQCYGLGQGAYVPLDAPTQSFGIGLSYAGHIEETASSFDPDAALAGALEQPRAPEPLCQARDQARRRHLSLCRGWR